MSRGRPDLRVVVLAAALGCAATSGAETAAVLTGRVEREDGSALREEWVWVVWDKGAPFRFEEGSRRVLNPKARTGSDGGLRIEVPAGFFGPGDALALAWEEQGGGRSHFTALHSADGERLGFELDELGRETDFGRLIAPAPRPD